MNTFFSKGSDRRLGQLVRLTCKPWAAPVALALASVVVLVLYLWIGRGLTYSVDELVWFMNSPQLDLHGTLQPYNGHLVAVSRTLYRLIFELGGTSYLPFRALAVLTLMLATWLIYIYAARRLPNWVAAGLALLILCFGADPVHVLYGNGFTILLALNCGLAALLLIDSGRISHDLLACLALTLGVLTYSTALPFVAGALVAVLLRDRSARSVWVALVPGTIYVVWWFLTSGQTTSSGESLALSQILFTPAWGFQSVSALLGSLSGLQYAFSDAVGHAEFGPTLALGFFLAVAWKIWSGGLNRAIAVALTVGVVLWAISASGATTGDSTPDLPRYMYSGLLVVMLIGAEVLRGVQWNRPAYVALGLVVVVSVANGLFELHQAGARYRSSDTAQLRPALTGIEAAETSAVQDDYRDRLGLSNVGTDLALSYITPNLDRYDRAVAEYGPLGYPPEEVVAAGGGKAAKAEQLFVATLQAKLASATVGAAAEHCSLRRADESGQITVGSASEGLRLSVPFGTAMVSLARFTDDGVEIGQLKAGRPAELRNPTGSLPPKTRVLVDAPKLTVCAP